MLLTLPLAAADCSSSFKSGIKDLSQIKDASKMIVNLDNKDVTGNIISTASYTPVSIAGGSMPPDVGCDANDKKAYVFKLQLDVGDEATFLVHNEKNSGSWQIRWALFVLANAYFLYLR